jgi:hypothetical protein
MNRKAIVARRQRNQQLAQVDRANRCVTCLRALPERVIVAFETGEKFCSEDCRDEHFDVPLVRLQP